MAHTSNPASLVRRLVKFALMAAFGGAVGFGVGWLFADIIPASAFADMRGADLGAVVLAAVLIAAGAIMITAGADRRLMTALTHGLEPAKGAERRSMRIQGGVIIGSGLLLAAPPAAALAGNPAPGAVFIALMTAFIVHSVVNYGLWRDGDEMMRRIIVEAGAACFWILQGALFIWAVAERLGLASGFSAWDALVVLMAVYLICSSVVGFRRGLS